jgi:6-phosphogluconolactonase/glucosamine-6-phosphate isomerase/deaminase
MKIVESVHPNEDAGKALTHALRVHQGKSVLLMVSGGSAWSILNFVEASVLGPHVTLTVLDERFSTDSAINNFAQLEHTEFYALCVKRGVKTISTNVVDGERIEDMRNRFDEALHAWKVTYPEGVIIGTMGIGLDGHTAGILPGEYEVDFNGDAWVVAYSVPKEIHQHTDRVTVTNTFLRTHVDEVVVFAIGEEKKSYVKILKGVSGSVATIPALVLREMKNVLLITDSIIE